MKRLCLLLTLLTFGLTSSLTAADNPFLDYQNYNHGYCPECDCAPCSCSQPAPPCNTCEAPCAPCDPCAPVCGAECGISLCAIAVGVAALVAAAVIIVTASEGSNPAHGHS